MILIALLQYLLLELLAVTCQEWIQGRIIGGYAPPPYTIKYMVSIQSTSGQHFCGGTLINKYWVLTAAHCDVGVEHMMIIAGDYSLSMYEGTEQFYRPYLLIPHPDYNKTTHNADIMLIKLRAPVVLNSYVSFAPLPRQDASVAEGRVCRVSGWGRTSPAGGQIPSVLRTVKLPIVSTARCNSSDSFNGSISENMICAGYSAGGKDACKGDSGGPLVCEGQVYGIVSWGEGCADARYPGVYTAVPRYRRWIDSIIFSYYSRCRKY
ncbi:trypsin isoform X1 [Alosa sapidissima]|uniref:trypsin isoform X1 n=2 Tax=Alosa sapidissima TaxID=34773 RepID=UPI001C09F7BC|nr:trypsin isoform X1 [Alosa sapidissima]